MVRLTQPDATRQKGAMKTKKSGEWAPYFLYGSVTSVDREKISGPRPVMRREIDGKWQYRPMTPEELADWNSNEAW
jgi:hypothetical protein